MKILGLSSGHDLGACLLVDGKIVCLIEEERLTRIKHGAPISIFKIGPSYNYKFGYIPWASLNYCLSVGGLQIDDLDAIMLPDVPALDWASILPIRDKTKIKKIVEPRGATHHYLHALTAFLCSPFEEAAVMVVDGDGSLLENEYEAESGYFFSNRKGHYETVFKNRYSNSQKVFKGGIGWTYEYVSMILGFFNSVSKHAEPGKTMGLSAYGKKNPTLSENWFQLNDFTIDFSRFHQWLGLEGGRLERVLAKIQYDQIPVKASEVQLRQLAADLAFKVQSELENSMLHLSEKLYQTTGSKNLCLAGGVALNSVANGVILKEGPFSNIFIQPAAGDNGIALGLALAGHLELSRNIAIPPIQHAIGGKNYDEDEIKNFLELAGLSFQYFENSKTLVESCVEELISDQVVAWFQGGSEFGPRSLGHRSILADPRTKEIKDRINRVIKNRELFRPFAPSVLKEQNESVFDLRGESPFMLLVAKVKGPWRSRVPGITHVDGSARVQTVDAAVDPLYHQLINRFYDRTGIPLLLNTSFNLRGMPIVESPLDAIKCFLFSEINVLYLQNFRVIHPNENEIKPFISDEWTLVLSKNRASFRNRDDDRRIEVPRERFYLRLVQGINGHNTLEQILDGTDRRKDGASYLRSLCRSGVIRLRIGKAKF